MACALSVIVVSGTGYLGGFLAASSLGLAANAPGGGCAVHSTVLGARSGECHVRLLGEVSLASAHTFGDVG